MLILFPHTKTAKFTYGIFCCMWKNEKPDYGRLSPQRHKNFLNLNKLFLILWKTIIQNKDITKHGNVKTTTLYRTFRLSARPCPTYSWSCCVPAHGSLGVLYSCVLHLSKREITSTISAKRHRRVHFNILLHVLLQEYQGFNHPASFRIDTGTKAESSE